MILRSRSCFVLTLLLVVVRPFAVEAVNPQFWTTTSFSDFSKGTLKGLSIERDGRLCLSPKFESVYDSDQALIWSAVIDSKQNLFLGTGHDGKVFKVDPKGTSSLFFDASELDVLALALDAEENLYVATSPDGRIYKVDAKGKGSVFFDPEDKFIWDLAFDSKGNLFVATGSKGKIYKVGKDGKGEQFFDSGQTNLVCMKIDATGNILVGSDPNGYLFRITPEGKAFVLYDTGMREVHDVQFDAEGTIYLVAISGSFGAPPVAEVKTPAPEMSVGETVSVSVSVSPATDKKVAEELPTLKVPSGKGTKRDIGTLKSSVFRISKDGSVQPLWSAEGETIYAVLPRGGEKVIFSTGTQGRIFSLDNEKKLTLLVETTEEQTTGLVPTGQDVLVTTSNLAKVYRLGNSLNNQGTYESDIKDTQSVSRWGSIQWKGKTPQGTSLKVYTRTGNTQKPDKTWSDWSKEYSNSEGDPITSPRARYIQYKVVFESASQASPSMDQIVVPYLQQNFAPEVKSITILPPGVAFQRTPGIAPTHPPISSSEQGSAEASGAAEAIPPQPTVSVPPRRVFQKGTQSFTWEAEDRNGDSLVYNVYFRGEKESEWRLLRKELDEKYLTLESDTLPDGDYQIRVVASDSPSNPKSMSLTGALISAVFDIDNTPPLVQVVGQAIAGKQGSIRFKATDATSVLRKAEVSIDGKEWEEIFSLDGIVDSKSEEFEVKTDGFEKGEHTVTLRAYDSKGNVGMGKAMFLVK
jgi:hypothetical protein